MPPLATEGENTSAQGALDLGQPNAEGQTPDTERTLNTEEHEDRYEPSEVEKAMAEGYKAAKAGQSVDTGSLKDSGVISSTDPGLREALGGRAEGETEGEKKPDAEPAPAPAAAPTPDERYASAEEFRKATAQLNGSIGALKSMIQRASSGKAITKDQLGEISKEFGDEYAEALAKDLSKLALGGVVDTSEIESKFQDEIMRVQQQSEFKFVKRTHRDYADFMVIDGKPGKQRAEFDAWLAAQGADKVKEFNDSWDADVICDAIQGFKDHKGKAAKEAARRESIANRSAAPTRGTSGGVPTTITDPIREGWNRVKGNQGRSARG